MCLDTYLDMSMSPREPQSRLAALAEWSGGWAAPKTAARKTA